MFYDSVMFAKLEEQGIFCSKIFLWSLQTIKELSNNIFILFVWSKLG